MPVLSEPATLQYRSATHKELKAIPKPKNKIVVSLYEFKDKTGQYKSSESGGSNSRAVTQGASVMVLQALEDSGWFIPIEREGLSNLLKERQLMDLASNETLMTSNNPLIYSDIILEGGIIAYESNIVTGGIGQRYLGTGASNQFREDRVTVYLRAISPKSGRILKTVSASKTIISNKIDVGIYKYLSPTGILEFEMGYGSNEPPQQCVLEAIEKAVYSLVLEGVEKKLWNFQDHNKQTIEILNKYSSEKLESEYKGSPNSYMERFVSISAAGLSSYIFSDYKVSELSPSLSLSVMFNPIPSTSFGCYIEKGNLTSSPKMKNDYSIVSGKIRLAPFIGNKMTPYMDIGAGGIYYNNSYTDIWSPIFIGELGLDTSIIENFSMFTSISYKYSLSDTLDKIGAGSINDSFISGSLGLTYYWEKKNEN